MRTAKSRFAVAGLALATAWTLLFHPPLLEAESGKDANPGKPVRSGPVGVRLYDVPLRDQEGRSVRFAEDVAAGRIVVVDTFFTTCGLICPILGAIFSDMQDQLGSLLDRDVRLISITVDPLTDVPPRLKDYSGRWGARPGWYFLTGEKKNVDHVLDGLGLYSADFTEHPPAFLVGDPRTGAWTRFYGFATPEQLMGQVRKYLDGRKSGAP